MCSSVFVADMICIALSEKNLHIPKYLDLVEVSRENKYFIDNSIYKRADQMIWPIQQRIFLEDATPRNLVISKNITDDRLYANIFRDGSSCHLHVVGKILKSQPILAARREVGQFNLREVMAGLELSCGEDHGGATTNPMTGDLPDAVGDVLQTGSDGVAASVHRPSGGGCYGVVGLDLRLQD